MFEQYVRLIRKMAGYYATRYNLPYEDVEAQAFLIYCETLEKFDISKGVKFITFLYTRLQALGDYCEAEKKRSSNVSVEDDLFYIPSRETFDIKDFLSVACQLLSAEAFAVLSWLVSFDWNDDRRKYDCRPSVAMVKRKFHYSRRKAERLWGEIRDFWNSEGYALYA